jgi:hypothetical protein
MSIERLYESDFPLQYCTKCGLVFADYRLADKHGQSCNPKEAT